MMDFLQRIYRAIFPEYQCPSCDGKLYRLYLSTDSPRVIPWKVDLLLTLVLLPFISGIFTKLLGLFFGILVSLLIFLAVVLLYYDRNNEYYACESCDKEYSYPELQKIKGK